jgi:hypothetical protein
MHRLACFSEHLVKSRNSSIDIRISDIAVRNEPQPAILEQVDQNTSRFERRANVRGREFGPKPHHHDIGGYLT